MREGLPLIVTQLWSKVAAAPTQTALQVQVKQYGRQGQAAKESTTLCWVRAACWRWRAGAGVLSRTGHSGSEPGQAGRDRRCPRAGPTPTGEGVLDPFHPYGRAKRLRGKPLSDFSGDLFLRVLAAEREQLVAVSIEARAWRRARGARFTQAPCSALVHDGLGVNPAGATLQLHSWSECDF